MVTRVALAGVLAACAGRAAHDGSAAPAGDAIALYRDYAVIRQRVEVDVPRAGRATVKVSIAADASPDDVVVIDRGGLREIEILGKNVVPDDADRDAAPAEDVGLPPPPDAKVVSAIANTRQLRFAEIEPTVTAKELEIVVTGPHAGHYALELAYVSSGLTWDAAYTMTTSPARDRAVLQGAIAIRNATAVTFHHAQLYVVDAELGVWRDRTASQLAGLAVGARPTTTPLAIPRGLGRYELGAGETRIELLPGARPRKLRSVLVYDPIGTKLDSLGRTPNHDLSIGATAAPTRVTESFEIERDEATSVGLPAGAVRLLERQPSGAFAVLGESRLFGVATRVADVDTVAIGTAAGVTGHRERREVTTDDDDHRLVEEFMLTIDNARAQPVDVVIREHMYRGENWSVSYNTSDEAKQEGPQQVSLRTRVPANSHGRVMYVVVYTW